MGFLDFAQLGSDTSHRPVLASAERLAHAVRSIRLYQATRLPTKIVCVSFISSNKQPRAIKRVGSSEEAEAHAGLLLLLGCQCGEV